jgi:hypothetical protein
MCSYYAVRIGSPQLALLQGTVLSRKLVLSGSKPLAWYFRPSCLWFILLSVLLSSQTLRGRRIDRLSWSYI